jgi:hypothetical protein
VGGKETLEPQREERRKFAKTVSLVSHTKESQKDLIATLRGGGTYQLWEF